MISESSNGAKFENIKSSKKTVVHRQDSSATICFLCLRNFHEAKILPCNHIFCLECIIPFLNPLNLLSCPKCKKEHLILQVHNITTAIKSEKMLLPIVQIPKIFVLYFIGRFITIEIFETRNPITNYELFTLH